MTHDAKINPRSLQYSIVEGQTSLLDKNSRISFKYKFPQEVIMVCGYFKVNRYLSAIP